MTTMTQLGVRPARLIESYYTSDQLVTAGPGRRLSGILLDGLLMGLTLLVGWYIWAAIVASRGQTPGKQLLGMYVMRDDATRAGGAFTYFVRESLVKYTLFLVLGGATGGILFLIGGAWCLWDGERQCLWDKVAGTRVAHSPRGFRPLTADEILSDLRRGDSPVGYAPLGRQLGARQTRMVEPW